MQKRITAGFLANITPPATGRLTYHDTLQPGLILRVSANGAKSWSVRFRVNGERVRETLGTLADIPSVATARARALASLEAARTGVNPVAERRAAAERAAANTVGAAAERWLEICARDLAPKTVRGYRQLFDHDVLPRWGGRPLGEIQKGDILELLDDKASHRERRRPGAPEGATVQANRLLTRLRTFFGWCVAHDLITADPSAGVRKPARESARDRVLGDDELKVFWEATGALAAERRDAIAFGPMFRLLLLTAARAGEIAGMRWSEIDVGRREWTIPAARTKNAKEHIVHLSSLALETLAGVPRAAGRDLVFSSTGHVPAAGFGRAKRRLDAAMVRESGDALAPWVIHDLRRTATTVMARLGIAPHVADKVLNHTAGTIRGVAAVYNRFEYLDERRAALEALGRWVAALLFPAESNVVELRSA